MSTLLFRRVSMFIVLIIAASMMVFVTGVMAQTATSDETEITGILESITSDSIVVSGQTISIVDAEIKAMLVIGGTVKAHVSEVNGVLIAREVVGAPPSDDNSNANENLNGNTNDNSNANENLNDNTNDNADDNSNDNTNLTPAVSAQDAIDAVLQVYPTTTILSVELKTKFGDTLVWEIKIRSRIEVTIDAQTGAILTIDRRSGDDNQNGNGNDNSDDNGNDNSDDNGNDNGNDDNGGMGSDDSGSDDNGGMG